jgi:Zn-dependent M28 family amino/carboxypeptidase
VRKVENAPLPPVEHVGDARSAPIATLVNYVNQDRWFSDVTTLAGWNRYTRGSQISQAQAWIQAQLAALPNVTVTTQPFTSGTTSGINVIATITGFATPNNWVIVGGHYDSTSQSPSSAAPGAEDDASGAAAVLEMARVFSQYPPPSTILLMFYSGEEQGLLGSAANAQSIVKNGDASKVKLMHNMDMIAYQTNPSGPKQVILETTSKFASLFPLYRESGTRYTTLGLFESTTAWGSDHESYITRGMPGLLTIDKDWDKYPSYHRTTDTPDKLTPSLGYQIIRLGVGAIAQAAGYTF